MSRGGYPTPLISAVLSKENNNQSEHLVKLLVQKYNADVNMHDKFGESALLEAVAKGSSSLVKLLVSHGASVNAANLVWSLNLGRTPLIKACMVNAGSGGSHSNSLEIVQFLLDNHAEVNATDSTGRSALSYATLLEEKHIMLCLLKAGSVVNIQDNNKMTPLILASQKGFTDRAAHLLQHGAGVNLVDNTGTSAYYHTVHRWIRLRRLLFLAGALSDGQDVLSKENTTWDAIEEKVMQRGHTVNKRGQVNNFGGLRNKWFLKGASCDSDNEGDNENWSYVPSLQHLTRGAIRVHTAFVNPNSNLFCLLPLLDIPPKLISYVMYEKTLEDFL